MCSSHTCLSVFVVCRNYYYAEEWWPTRTDFLIGIYYACYGDDIFFPFNMYNYYYYHYYFLIYSGDLTMVSKIGKVNNSSLRGANAIICAADNNASISPRCRNITTSEWIKYHITHRCRRLSHCTLFFVLLKSRIDAIMYVSIFFTFVFPFRDF